MPASPSPAPTRTRSGSSTSRRAGAARPARTRERLLGRRLHRRRRAVGQRRTGRRAPRVGRQPRRTACPRCDRPRVGNAVGRRLSPDGSEMLVGTSGRGIERLSADTGELLAERPRQMVGQLAVQRSDQPRLAAGGLGGQLPTGAAPSSTATTLSHTRRFRRSLTAPVQGFSPDGALLASGGRALCAIGGASVRSSRRPAPSCATGSSRSHSGREVLDLGDEDVPRCVQSARSVRRRPVSRRGSWTFDSRADLYDVVDRRLIGTLPVPDLLFSSLSTRPAVAGRIDGRRRGLGDRRGGRCRRRPLQDAIVLDLVVDDAGSPTSTSAPTTRWPSLGSATGSSCWTCRAVNCCSSCGCSRRLEGRTSSSGRMAAT